MYVLFRTFYKFNHVFLMIKGEYCMVLIRFVFYKLKGLSNYYSSHFIFSGNIVFLSFISSTMSRAF
jgi:hypothetical protein